MTTIGNSIKQLVSEYGDSTIGIFILSSALRDALNFPAHVAVKIEDELISNSQRYKDLKETEAFMLREMKRWSQSDLTYTKRKVKVTYFLDALEMELDSVSMTIEEYMSIVYDRLSEFYVRDTVTVNYDSVRKYEGATIDDKTSPELELLVSIIAREISAQMQ